MSPRVVQIRDVPLLAQLADHVGRECHRLGGSVVEWPESVAAAFACGERSVETHADHVDDFVLLPYRNAGEAHVGEVSADVGVDLVLDHQLLGLAATDVGLGLVVGHDELDRPPVDPSRLVDAIDCHLDADQCGLAAGGSGAGERLHRSDLVGIGLAEGFAPRCRYQHGRAERAGGCGPVSDETAAGDLAAVPESPIVCLLVVDHRSSS